MTAVLAGQLAAPSGPLAGRGKAPVAGRVVGFRVRPVRVQAMLYDGSPAGADRLTAWVHRLGPSTEAVVFGPDGVATVVETWSDGRVQVPPGHYLVLAQGAGCRWAVHSPAQMQTWFEPCPRELPIFDDGEVAS